MRTKIEQNRGMYFRIHVDNDAAHISRNVDVDAAHILTFLGKYILAADPRKKLKLLAVYEDGKPLTKLRKHLPNKYMRISLFPRFEEELVFERYSRNYIPTDEGFNRVQSDYNGY